MRASASLIDRRSGSGNHRAAGEGSSGVHHGLVTRRSRECARWMLWVRALRRERGVWVTLRTCLEAQEWSVFAYAQVDEFRVLAKVILDALYIDVIGRVSAWWTPGAKRRGAPESARICHARRRERSNQPVTDVRHISIRVGHACPLSAPIPQHGAGEIDTRPNELWLAFVMRAEVSKTLAMLNQLQLSECLCLYPPYISLTSTHPNQKGFDGRIAAQPLNERIQIRGPRRLRFSAIPFPNVNASKSGGPRRLHCRPIAQ